jgi:hypothetical protein
MSAARFDIFARYDALSIEISCAQGTKNQSIQSYCDVDSD